MDTMTLFWLITIPKFGVGLVLMGVVAIAVFSCGFAVFLDHENKQSAKTALKWVVISIIVTCIGGLIPNKKEMAALYLVPKIINNETVKSIGSNGLNTLDALVKEWLETLKPTIKTND